MLIFLLLSSIVFSSWKKTLDLVFRLFEAKRIPHVSIDGSLSLPERAKVLSDFHNKSKVTVLLMTLGTGALG
jgi:SNF2 family DNA or RNA helicase